MNYMKILLIYMAATMSLAVQSTTAPVETPVPTPAPVLEQQQEQQAEGTDADVPIIGVETVQAAAPSETPPPVPEGVFKNVSPDKLAALEMAARRELAAARGSGLHKFSGLFRRKS